MATICQILFYVLVCISGLVILLGVVVHLAATSPRREELRQWKEKQNSAPSRAVFVAYRALDETFAQSVRQVLESHGIRILMWKPSEPFEDPVQTIFDFIDGAAAIIVIRPEEASDWIQGEREIAERMGKKVLDVHPGSDLPMLAAHLERSFDTSKPFATAPWGRFILASETLRSRVDSQIWSRTRLDPDTVGESTVPGILLAFLLYAVAFWLGCAAFLLRWLASRVL
jgi:hypothetical protein